MKKIMASSIILSMFPKNFIFTIPLRKFSFYIKNKEKATL
jgi:hypothetical protein